LVLRPPRLTWVPRLLLVLSVLRVPRPLLMLPRYDFHAPT
jgi:hypothetical protein